MSQISYINPDSLQSIDSMPIKSATIATLNLDRVAAHIKQAVERDRYRGPTTPLEYLRHKRCLATIDGEECVTLAGLLCFGHDPQAYFPKAVVDLGHYSGTKPLSFEVIHLGKDIGGTLTDQFGRLETYLLSNTRRGMTLSESSFQSIDLPEYPRPVIRELCVNMLAHRDYLNLRSASRVMLFRNRIEWVSPGGLPQGISVENILDEQAARNPIILSILYEASYVEAFGQGLDTVVTVLEQEGMEPPKFHDTGASFIVTVFGRQLDVLSGDGRYSRLNDLQRKIVVVLRTRGTLAPRDVFQALPQHPQRTIQNEFRRLRESGLVTAEGAGRALRYRLSDDSADYP